MKPILVPRDKKGGIVTNVVFGVGGLILGVIVVLVLVSTVLDAGLLSGNTTTTGFNANHTAQSMGGNFTSGLNNITTKLPTILLIVAVVFLFGVLILLIRASKSMGIGETSSL